MCLKSYAVKFLDTFRWGPSLCVSMTILTGLFLHFEAATPPIFAASTLAVVLAFTHVNLYNYFTDLEEDRINDQYNPVQNRDRRRQAILYLASSLVLIVVVGYLWLPVASVAIALFYVILGYVYSHQRLRFKERFLLKNLTIGVGYGSLLLVVTTGLAGEVLARDLALAAFYGMFSFHGSVVRDLFDIRGDAEADVRTIPVVLGRTGTANALVATIVPWMALVAVPVHQGLLPPRYLALTLIVPLLLKRPYYVYTERMERVNPKGLPGIVAATIVIFVVAVSLG